ncbi:heat stress transcription factor A-6b [Pyrus ussuriensis x Pyrus communis]|uniref:Heat stress transcription factor A-6b n=1 Tax=Pyrus ussuriensis x Pyrus communis TaxID=2448454 RepID=A0A5N5GKQ1_9ROSA|nr:heat stress transcription factor A-6b [Pyrus ussuriensis x Pyrus communis]
MSDTVLFSVTSSAVDSQKLMKTGYKYESTSTKSTNLINGSVISTVQVYSCNILTLTHKNQTNILTGNLKFGLLKKDRKLSSITCT